MNSKRRPGWIVLSLAVFAVGSTPLAAAVRLPNVLGDQMVLQRDKPVKIWGWAAPGEPVTVTLAGREAKTAASADGRWEVSLPAFASSAAPLELVVRGASGPPVTVKDILVGEVWVASGQSNMEWALSQTLSPTPEILRANHPGLRLFRVPRRTSERPQEDVEAKWTPCTPEFAGPFSAVAYYFGLELHQKLGVPVGLIESAWGGTMIEPWTPPAGFAAVPELAFILDGLKAKSSDFRSSLQAALPKWEDWILSVRKSLAENTALPVKPDLPPSPFDNPQTPLALYHGMIHPLINFAVRGAIWYQGEANRNDGLLYEKKMEALIRGWRAVWKDDGLPFYYVQIAPFNYAYDRELAGGVPDFLRLPLLWEAQTNVLRIPQTGLAVVNDIADLADIHPRNKRDVGLRLALWARAKTYGEKDLVFSGPLFKSAAFEGGRAVVSFDHVGGGLTANDGQPLRWFELAGEDRVFYKASAKVEGDRVAVSSPNVPTPKAVRFGWHQLAVPNLANKEGLPASPFRTDRW
jgi:sialate O-acetylesterase